MQHRSFFTLFPVLVCLAVLQACASQQPPPQSSYEHWQWHQSPANGASPTARHEGGLAVVGDQLYLIGGRGQRPLDILDMSSGQWRTGAALPEELNHFQAVTVGKDIYIVGAMQGRFPKEDIVPHIWIYSTESDNWAAGPELPKDRLRGGGGVVLHQGSIYFVGGNRFGHSSGFVPWLDRLDLATGQWQRLADAPQARDHFHAAIINGKLYAAGGRLSASDTGDHLSRTVAQMDVYDITTDTWQTVQSPLPTPRAGVAVVAMGDLLVVMGGESGTQEAAHSEAESFDTKTQSWLSLPLMPQGRHGTQAVVIDGAIHILAGSGNRGGGPELNDHLIFKQRSD
jgi:N-acetylneuraminic acid mutarotase